MDLKQLMNPTRAAMIHYGPSGGLRLIVVFVVILLLAGRI